MLQLDQVKLPIQHAEKELEQRISRILHLGKKDDFSYEIRKRSIDARKKPELFYVYQIWVKLSPEKEKRILEKAKSSSVKVAKEIRYCPEMIGEPDKGEKLKHPPVIIGAGPAGLFCAFLLTEQGFAPIVCERGRQADRRQKDVEKFWETGVLDPVSNVQFGEGGAGAFSDGKLNTGVKDPSGRIRYVLETFVRFGAPSDILIDQKPHIGTDILTKVIVNMRKYLEEKGCRFYFETQAVDFLVEDGRLKGVWARNAAGDDDTGRFREPSSVESFQVSSVFCSDDMECPTHEPGGFSGEEQAAAGSKLASSEQTASERFLIETEIAVLAIGHSARDTFRKLHRLQVPMTAKSFAVGFRVEHPQSMMDEAMYGRKDRGGLSAAPYKVTANFPGGRGVYSFCMCPGGYVVAAASGREQTVVNGMSYSGRQGTNANSAIIVSVTPEDFGADGPLAGIAYQEHLEKRAWELGAGKIPQQLFGDFCDNRTSLDFGDFESAAKGLRTFSNLRGIFSEDVERFFMAGMEQFGRRIRGFDRPDAILSGVESRTSSPVRILRNEAMESEVRGLYPCGEGAGYAGGITSAAVDGLKVAEAICNLKK